MLDWLDSVTGPGYGAAILWTAGALILLVIILIVIKMIRSLTFGTFVAGGRNRKTRLAVMDATAVDSHRRLVLIRRDDVEHLLLIGGPTDVVVERDIRLAASRRSNLTNDAKQMQPASSASRPSAPRSTPVSNTAPVTSRPQAIVAPPHSPVAAPRHQEQAQQASATHSAGNNQAALNSSAQAKHAPSSQLDGDDDALMDELTLSLDEATMGNNLPKAPPPSPDDEMAKLLGELSSLKR